MLNRVEPVGQMKAVATYIPEFPIYPPEFSWMDTSCIDIPAMLAGESPYGGRIFYFAGDADRCYGRAGLPDHGDLLGHAVKWALKDQHILKVEAPGSLDCKLYRQNDRILVHLVNLSVCNIHPGYAQEILPVGPVSVSVKIFGKKPERAALKVRGQTFEPIVRDGWACITFEKLQVHELLIFE